MSKYFYLGCALLAVLLVVTLSFSLVAQRQQTPIRQLLCRAIQAGLPQGRVFLLQARAHWQQYRAPMSALADHDPMEQLDGLFCQALFFADHREPVQFAATCTQLLQLLQTLADAQQLSWQNLF